jgi:hypothetical protein
MSMENERGKVISLPAIADPSGFGPAGVGGLSRKGSALLHIRFGAFRVRHPLTPAFGPP